MLISLKKIIGLDVETESGKILGQARDLAIDQNLSVIHVSVKPQGLVKGLVAGDLVIPKNSIISVSSKKIIVEDLMEKNLVKEKEKKQLAMSESPVSALSLE